MTAKTYSQLAAEAAARITEILPWDVPAFLEDHPDALLLDIRERDEFDRVRIEGSINVPRGILESGRRMGLCRDRARPRHRPRHSPSSSSAAPASGRPLPPSASNEMGFADPRSVKLGIKGWNDADQPLVDATGAPLDGDDAMPLIERQPRPDQRRPAAE